MTTTTKTTKTATTKSEAVISDCERYRYLLSRQWTPHKKDGTVLWVMLNPSTANHVENDPTIRRCIGYSKKWGFSRLEVVNLFAYRATKPADLLSTVDPIGPENDFYIQEAAARARLVIYGWGATAGKIDRIRPRIVHQLVYKARKRCSEKHKPGFIQSAQALWTTSGGHPSHPLFLSYDCTPEPYNVIGK